MSEFPALATRWHNYLGVGGEHDSQQKQKQKPKQKRQRVKRLKRHKNVLKKLLKQLSQ